MVYNNNIDKLLSDGAITYMDYEIYKWIFKFCGSEIISLIGLIVNFKLRSGDTYILLDEIENKKINEIISLNKNQDAEFNYKLPYKINIIEEFKTHNEIVSHLFTIGENGMIFFKRIYNYEKDVANILKKIAKISNISGEAEVCNFQADSRFNNTDDPQALAVKMAETNRLLIISGGPGTGKTTTVKKIIETLKQKKGVDLNIALTAPTGKAVSRLSDLIKDLIEVNNSDLDAKPIKSPVTIHKLVGANPFNTSFRYNEKNRLPYDIIIADEFSMVSLELAHRLLISVKDDAKLILLGDKDQLASVEAGAVMGEICNVNDSNPLKNCLVEFTRNYRFKEDSGIGLMSKAIKTDDFSALKSIIEAADCEKSNFEDLYIIEAPSKNLFNEITDGYFDSLGSLKDGDQKLDCAENAISSVKVLTPYNETEYGSKRLNEIIDKKLRDKLAETQKTKNTGKWYPGRQVIITANDYQNELFNGDIGICSKIDDKYRIRFTKSAREGSSSIRTFEPFLLPKHDLAFALTVHKSQGSEFDNIYFFTGDAESNILNRELIYTAVTRAKKKLVIIGKKDLLIKSLKKKTARKSVISDFLCSC